MRIQELAEELQEGLEEGVMNYIVYQEGRQWKYELYPSFNSENVNEEEEKRFLYIKYRLDDEVIVINGKKDFDSYDLKYIQKQIKALRSEKGYV
ncbi:hypothetical protein RH915_05600 [Serpentinicella sp. ANB-PHB4]|uniref:hypothetical protein n=1 Tax=Serpentinicella sp. ANB-PHB4 TaxID=3074076 RepID=UPI0028635B65|nr:hypothetical protein [Serpentinicella sp. ANB-PHB4]MDR5658957.1 hypothetical protein [Serpentinicella sp. ANB-PHB4]